MSLPALLQWQGCLDSLQEAVWLIDACSHRVLFANASAARLALQSASDFVGRHVLEIASTPQDLAFWDEAPEVLAQGIESVSSLLRSDGVLLSVERRVAAFSTPESGTLLLMSMVDRSAQQTGQRKLEASLAQLRATLDSAADGMLVCGLDGTVHAFNQRLAHIWKMPQNLLVQRNDDAVHAFMAACVSDPTDHAQRLRALALAPDAPGNDLISLRDGRTLERRSLPQVCQGSVTGRVFSFRDITEELKWQAELRLAAQVFEYSADAIFIADSAHQLVQVNPAAEVLLGESLHQLRGRKAMTLLKAGLDDIDLLAQVQGAWMRDGIWRSEVTVIRPGDACAAYLSWVAVRDARGQVDKSIGFLHDLTERQAAQQQIDKLAYIDSLTGLPNRLMFAQHVERILKEADAGNAHFAVLFLDLDRFKIINDSLGHAFGDRVLQLVAARLQSSLRSADMLCRLGSDEFVVYLHECSVDTAERIARRILGDMRNPFTLDGIGFSIQCSMGVATCPQDGSTLNDLITHADTAMYRVKEQGSGNYGFYRPEMNANLLERMQMEHAMRHALEEERMSVHYQPQIQLGTNQIVGAEALLRWTDPERGSVSPAVFIPLAEETGYIVTLGAWVLEQAVQQAACWMRKGISMVVSVNVSALEFRQPDFVQQVTRLLQLHGLSEGLLELELTESILLQDAKDAAQRLAALAALGVTLAIDDFGTGYSSMAYLKNLPLHKLKIDQSFICGLPTDESDQAMVSAMVHMGHALKMDVVAEGVETQEQRALLQELGCDYFQGYLCAPALPPAALDALMRQPGSQVLGAPQLST